jgi:hypothetical protein
MDNLLEFNFLSDFIYFTIQLMIIQVSTPFELEFNLYILMVQNYVTQASNQIMVYDI